MANEEQNVENEARNQEQDEKGAGEAFVGSAGTEEKTVTISKEVYESLLAAVAENTEATKKILSRVDDEEQALERERQQAEKASKVGRYSKVSSPEEFAQLLIDDIKSEVIPELMQSAIQPIANTVMSIVVADEIKNVRANYPDFDKYKDEVYKQASANPKLTIEEAYLIASGKVTKKAGEEKPQQKSAGAIKSGGEKSSGVSSSSVDKTGYKTTRDAARAAFEKIYGK